MARTCRAGSPAIEPPQAPPVPAPLMIVFQMLVVAPEVLSWKKPPPALRRVLPAIVTFVHRDVARRDDAAAGGRGGVARSRVECNEDRVAVGLDRDRAAAAARSRGCR